MPAHTWGVADVQVRSKESSASRERILQMAARLFHEQGYGTTTVRDIAKEVGILSGSLFHHFASKEEMLLEIMREAAHAVCERAETILSRELSDQETLRELIRLEFDSITHETRRHFHGVLFFEWRQVPEDAKPEFWRLRRRYQHSWMMVLERCRAAGRLRCEPQAASLILHGALRNALTWYSPQGRYNAEEFGEILARLVLET
jgi:AcrR family transcriptional regulator